jgi:hypothetical protein
MTQDLLDSDLNAEAVYAGMVWFRTFAESEAGKAYVARVTEQASEQLDSKLKQMLPADTPDDVKAHLCPKLDPGEQVLSSIFPGEEESVSTGIDVARRYLWGKEDMKNVWLDVWLNGDDAIAIAMKRFLATRIH